MTHDPQRHRRRSIRLQRYDYRQPGAYFVTVCTQDRACLFGHIVNGEMQLNPYGRVAATLWGRIPRHFPHVQLDQWVVMPNHIHGIIRIVDPPAPGRGEAFPDRRSNVLGATSGESSITGKVPDEECFAPTNDASLDTEPNPAGTGEASPDRRFNPAGDPTGRGEAFPDRRSNVLGATSGESSITGKVPDEECLAPTEEYLALTSTPTSTRAPAPGSLGAILGNFKSVTARRINRMRKTPGAPVWQRNYYEHIIRNADELHRIRQYVIHNPASWLEDENHPARVARS